MSDFIDMNVIDLETYKNDFQPDPLSYIHFICPYCGLQLSYNLGKDVYDVSEDKTKRLTDYIECSDSPNCISNHRIPAYRYIQLLHKYIKCLEQNLDKSNNC